MSNIIFLNFIIAEASESYNKVKEKLEALIQLERANMINECEQMAPPFLKDKERFPRYIIMRTVEKWKYNNFLSRFYYNLKNIKEF